MSSQDESTWKCAHCRFRTNDTEKAQRHSIAYGHTLVATGYNGILADMTIEAD